MYIAKEFILTFMFREIPLNVMKIRYGQYATTIPLQ